MPLRKYIKTCDDELSAVVLCLSGAEMSGTQFFCFRMHFCHKAPTSDIDAPPSGLAPPQREILDPPLILYVFDTTGFAFDQFKD